jgi:uncharacterized integral membrane protein
MTTAPHDAQPPHDADRDPVQEVPQHEIVRTRVSGVWVAIGFFTIVLLFLLIFILQNGHSVDVSYLGLHSRLPLGVALLLSAVCGVLLVVLAGTARILQLRAAARRHRRADAKAARAATKEAKAATKEAKAATKASAKTAKTATVVPPGDPD